MYRMDRTVPLRTGRGGSARWQWLAVGIMIGLSCAGAACVIGYLAGVLSFHVPEVATINQVGEAELCVTATPDTPVAAQPTGAISVAADQNPSPAPQTPTPTPTPTEPLQGPTLTISVPGPSPVPPTLPPPMPTAIPEGSTGEGTPAQPVMAGNGTLVDPVLLELATELRPVPGGTFQMGTNVQEATIAVQECLDAGGNCQLSWAEDSFPPHPVTLTSFQMERFEVTNVQYVAFLNSMGPESHLTGCDGQRCINTQNEYEYSAISFDGTTYRVVSELLEQHPVTNVSWFGARAYCEALGRRLPTEAEWERAARGDDGRIYPWGNTFSSDLAVTRPYAESTMPVGTHPGGASPYGIEDMAGNAAEWVADWYQFDFYSTVEATVLDPSGPATGTERVIRGGSWDAYPFFARTVHRQSATPNTMMPWLGFRCVSDEAIPPTAIPPEGAEVPPEQPAGEEATNQDIPPTATPTLPPGGG